MDWKQIEAVNKELDTVDLKGKDYVMVNKRVLAFRKICPMGSIVTDILSNEDGVVLMKTTISDETGKVLGTGMAYEREASSFINKTSYIENCVPIDTQILTEDGWKYYHQIKKGTKVWSYNIENNEYEFAEILDINVYDDRPVVELSTSRFKAVCTPAHKWVVGGQYAPIHKVATQDLKVSEKIIQAVPQAVDSSAIGRQLGWLMCDCEINKTANGLPSSAYISQSKYTSDISELFGEASLKTKRYDFSETWKDNYEWIIPAEEVRRILGYFGIADYRDLPRAMASAELEDVQGCYDSMMLADGTDGRFSSTYPELIEAMQIMCARLGIATTHVTERMCQRSTKPIYTLGIKSTSGAYFSEMEVRNLPPRDVWCPTTSNGTWIMKQGDFVTLTSNCETSAVGRALAMLGIGVDASMCSAEELANAVNNQGKKTEKPVKADQTKVEVLLKKAADAGVAEAKLFEVAKIVSMDELTVEKWTELMALLDKQIKNKKKETK